MIHIKKEVDRLMSAGLAREQIWEELKTRYDVTFERMVYRLIAETPSEQDKTALKPYNTALSLLMSSWAVLLLYPKVMLLPDLIQLAPGNIGVLVIALAGGLMAPAIAFFLAVKVLNARGSFYLVIVALGLFGFMEVMKARPSVEDATLNTWILFGTYAAIPVVCSILAYTILRRFFPQLKFPNVLYRDGKPILSREAFLRQ